MNRAQQGLVAAVLAYSGLVHAQAMSPQDFAYGQVAIPAHDAAAYRFPLPLTVYQNTFREDLGDLRVFNADGVVVPFSLSRPAAQSLIHQTPIALPMFPLPEGARILIDGVHLTINSAGSAVNLQTQNGTPVTAPVRQYLLDARALDATISALQLGWPDGAAEYTGRLSIEASEDLAAWRFVVAAAPIANLHADGQTLVENRLEFAPTKAKFWRLSWLGLAPSFELTSLLAEPAASPTEPDRASLEVNGVTDPKNSREFTFDLSGHPPVSRVNVLLPDPNSVMDVELSSRSTPSAPWRSIIRSGFYRLKTPDTEQQNSLVEVRPDTDRYWRARILGAGDSPQSSLRLHVEWVPNEVTFLAQGNAPYLLAYGNATANRAEADLSRLPNSLGIATATLGPAQVTGGATRLIAKPAPFPRMRVALWSVLLLSVAVLAWMTYRIARDPKDNLQT
jgi:Protein of unknown function (DUF3999)